MALFSEKYGSRVRVVTIGESKELCGGTHIKNTSEIEKLACFSAQSKGSNVYRIEACTNDSVEDILLDTIKPYNDEKIKLLMKARNIISKAKKEGIILDFECNIVNEEPKSYKDIIFEKNELEYVQNEVKNLEKKYKEEKAKLALNDLSIYENKIEEKNNAKILITTVENQDMNILKDIVDTLLNKMGTGFILIANINKDQVNFVARNNIENVSAGDIMKFITSKLNGNGGGSKTFAQGAGKDISNLNEVLIEVKEQL
jgi:alanyl-tRNA synthetase